MSWKMLVSIIFGHTDKIDIERTILLSTTVKSLKVLLDEGPSDFNSSVGAEVIKNKTILIFD